jgi:putative ABC transport system permease protein
MSIWQDVRFAARTLRNSPGFAVTAVITLALGIGATTAIFSVCDAMLWKPIALPRMDSLVMVLERDNDDANNWSETTPADTDDIHRGVTALENFASFQFGMANLVGSGGEPERVSQALVNANFFDSIGVQPALGRTFAAGEDQPGREREVILSDRIWKRRFGGDPSIIGQPVRFDDQNFQVVGVMPASYDFPLATDVWTPTALKPADRSSRRGHQLVSVARLKAGRTIGQAGAELDSIGTRLAVSYPDTNRNRRFMLRPAYRFLVDYETNQYLFMLLGSVAFVLLIACVNVANLQFARATGRLREVAVRTALGAGRWRVIAQLVTESVILSLSGAILGLLLANWGVRMIHQGMPPEIERYIVGWNEMGIDSRALIFTLVAAVLAGILAGMAPAWQCSRPNLTDALKEGGRGGSAGKARHVLRNALVGVEVALAVILLVGAGLMVRGFRALVDNGGRLQPATLLTLRLAITEHRYQQPHEIAAFYRQVLERIQPLPGVTSVSAITAMPYSDHSSGRNFTIEGRPVEPGNQPSTMYQVTSASYFPSLHVALLAGRFLSETDGADAPKVAVVSNRLVQRWFPHQSPIGKHIKLGATDSTSPWITIVGVVADLPHDPYERQPRPTLYVPYPQTPALSMDIGVRTSGDPLRVAPAVTLAIRSVDAEEPVTEMRTMERAIHDRSIGLNYMAVLMGIFGVVALILSAVGVYGVMAYLVSEQTREIGIRMALGSPKVNVMHMILRRGMITTLAGLAAGLPVAYGFARLMASLIYGVTANDPVSFLAIPLALVAAAALAVFIPARRAMNIDPIVALRYE